MIAAVVAQDDYIGGVMTNRLRALTVCAAAFLLAACQTESGPALTALPYTDDFGNPQSGWTISSDLSGDVKYDAGRLRILVKNENFTIWSTANKLFKDAVYEVDAQPVGGPTDNGFGVLFRVKDRQNFYHFEISSDGYWRAGLMKDGKWQNWADWLQHPAIKADGTPNRIKITMKGDKIDYFVNDTLITSRTDADFPSGDVGVFALTVIDNAGTDVAFDNVSITAAP